METDTQDAQVLGDSVFRNKQSPRGRVLECAGKATPTTPDDIMWLKKNPGLDTGVCWDNLKISENGVFSPPAKKRDTDGKTMVNSPVSTLAICWSPQATLAPPLKRRGASESCGVITG